MSEILSSVTDDRVPVPNDTWDRDEARKALDELFTVARQYNSSAAYFELMRFIANFRSYSPFNAMLVHTQMPGARFVAPAQRWVRQFRRQIKVGARPLVILQPMGPVLFVFDVSDTDALSGAPALPVWVEHPFEVRHGKINGQLEQTIENAKRDGINIGQCPLGSQRAGSIQATGFGGKMTLAGSASLQPIIKQVERRYELLLNSNLSREARYATLVHELGHLYCGHLGTPQPKWWPDRRGLPLEIREFEAESVCYLVCTRLGISNLSAEYLAAYVRNYQTTPPISLDAIIKASSLIEQIGRERLGLRTESQVVGFNR